MKKKELFKQLSRLPDDTEIKVSGSLTFDIVKITRRGVTSVELEACDEAVAFEAVEAADEN